MKYKQWLKQWLDDFVKPISKERTLIKYNQQIIKHISPFLGEYELDELSPHLLQRFMSYLIMRGLATNTVKGIATIIKLSLRRAVLLRLTEFQYSDAIVLPSAREKLVQSFNKREQRIIEDYVLDSKRKNFFGIIISLYTGLRIGELLALQWSDIDFVKARITVNKSCHDEWVDGKYRKVIGATKTDQFRAYDTASQTTAPKAKTFEKIFRKRLRGIGQRSLGRGSEDVSENV